MGVDFGSLSFPRCFGVRFHAAFLKKYHLIGMQAKWDSFEDKDFTKPLGKDFEHEDLLTREGWAKYYFKGKYPKDVAYIRLRIVNPQTGMLSKVFYFQFKKSYQTSLDGRYYVTDPVLGDKIIKDGILIELKKVKKSKDSEEVVFKKRKSTFKVEKIRDVMDEDAEREKIDTGVIIQTSVRYSEKPKMVFLVEILVFFNQILYENIRCAVCERTVFELAVISEGLSWEAVGNGNQNVKADIKASVNGNA